MMFFCLLIKQDVSNLIILKQITKFDSLNEITDKKTFLNIFKKLILKLKKKLFWKDRDSHILIIYISKIFSKFYFFI